MIYRGSILKSAHKSSPINGPYDFLSRPAGKLYPVDRGCTIIYGFTLLKFLLGVCIVVWLFFEIALLIDRKCESRMGFGECVEIWI